MSLEVAVAFLCVWGGGSPLAKICGFFHLRQSRVGQGRNSYILKRKSSKVSGTDAAYFNSFQKIPWPCLGGGPTVLGKTVTGVW